ncbi:MAG: response regulator [Nostocaceae cyanobacterium]|nr:response regulator [Nostocaceae cyanobacterium]
MTTQLPKTPSKILVIDDNISNLEILHLALSCSGYEVLAEIDGKRGIAHVRNNPPDLILLDIMMPEIDGFETCHILQSDPKTRDIPIIFMTALCDTLDKVKGLNLGAVDYITKPFQHDEIIARIEVHLKLRKLNLELAHQKEILEQRVQERTAELSQVIEELKKVQLQLVHTEKISSLGQLVAGIAHEVNNPIGFISGNLHHANQYVKNLINLVNLYQKKFPEPGEEITDEINNIDLNYILEDLPKLLSSMHLGTNRIQDIMQSLRNFSRVDGADKKPFDIHSGIESTLMILQHRLKGKTERPPICVIKEYGDLPEVECYPGQLNQVFMNLLANAIDALEIVTEEPAKYNPIILISTSVINQQIAIQICDNGIGICREFYHQIFVPFFTTKPPGKGTGLGLSISYKIITENHGGSLECFSEPGKGTKFVIKIPIFSYG